MRSVLSLMAIAVLVSISGALAFEGRQASVSGGPIDTWQTSDSGRPDAFWFDVNGEGSPDVYLAMLGIHYRQVQIDADRDGRPDLIVLQSRPGDYVRFMDLDGDGLWEQIALPPAPAVAKRFNAAQGMLLRAVENRIFLDAHSQRWNSVQTPAPPRGFFTPTGQPKAYRLRLTHTPSAAVKDPNREIKPVRLGEFAFSSMAGIEQTHDTGATRFARDLPQDTEDKPAGSLRLNFFHLPTKTDPTARGIFPGEWIQVSGRLDIGGVGGGDFCAIVQSGPAAPAVATVPTLDAFGRDAGFIFIEVFPGR